MKTTSKTLLTLALATTGLAAFATENSDLFITQDAHGGTRTMFVPAEQQNMSVALFVRGQAISSNRSEENRGTDITAVTSFNQHSQSVTRYELQR